MFKEELQKLQPVVYRTLENALLYNKLAHAYLFVGPAGTMKKETAYLLAQSLVCEHDGFACETCDECQRVLHNNYADMIYLDGRTTSIKKADIVKLQHEFNKTGLETAGKKVYIIDGVENTTPDALNSLLKFLEEPSGDMIAILLTQQIDLVLPTIISRCQHIAFTALSEHICFEKSKDQMNHIDAYFLSKMIRNVEEMMDVKDSDDYQHAYYLFKGFIDNFLQTPYRALLFLQIEGPKSKQKKLDKRITQYVLDMLLIFYKDCMSQKEITIESWYDVSVKKMRTFNIDYITILETLMRMQDKLLKSVNISLLIDQMVYEMKEVVK